MKTVDIIDPVFRQAVEAIDAGNAAGLKALITEHTYLLTRRLPTNEEGYFKNPYLFWFIADNPIRIDKLPPNIVAITQLLIDALKQSATDTLQYQLDYALGLVATGRIPRECDVQIAMMDALINAGAIPGGGMGAFAHGNIEAANYLIDRGGKLTLGAAVCLGRVSDMEQMITTASAADKLTALTAAAFYGKADMVKYLLDNDALPNGYPDTGSGFHSHATPLHQAVYSGSLETVRLLVEAGADINAVDKIYNGNPIGWAHHMHEGEAPDEQMRGKYMRIVEYLQKVN